MQSFGFFTGLLTATAILTLLAPWLRTLSPLTALTSTPLRAGVSAAVLAAMTGLYVGFGHPGATVPLAIPIATSPSAPAPLGGATPASASAFGLAAKTFGEATGAPIGANPAPAAKAGSMDSAVANLQARLAKGGGTPGDWELLAKSYEFLGRPEDAAKARRHELPALGATPAAPAAGVNVRGEVTLDAALSAKAVPGDTLFILAKSVDSPGAPVAVIRTSVGTWPVAFTLDDSQSMMPGRTLSTAGKVTIEARISKKGQPLAAPGDLQGASGVIDPSHHEPLKIKIDRVIG